MLKSISCYIVILLSFSFSFADEIWKVNGGATSIRLYENVIKDLGFASWETRATSAPHRANYNAFGVQDPRDVTFQAPAGDFETLATARLFHRGGFSFHLGDEVVSLEGFQIQTGFPDGELMLADKNGVVWFLLRHAHPYLRPEESRLLLLNMDMIVSSELANMLGDISYANVLAGTVDMELWLDVPEGLENLRGTCTPNFSGTVDVELTSITSVSQAARSGGLVALTAGASLANVGTADVPWFRAIEPDGGVPPEEIGQHPYLALHFYRIHNDVVEQLGQADVKHAFFSVNSGCSCPGGQVLYVGCGDTYGGSTNINRFYLAPRDEVTASTGVWKSQGSHFDGDPVDNFRDHGSTGHDSFQHRLTVQETDLQPMDASYYMELWYIVQGDVNIFNSMAYLQTIPSFNGSMWTFQSVSGRVPGPAIDAWVAPGTVTENQVHRILDTGEGHLKMAIKVTEIPDGYHYEIALMNLDFDRQINSLSVPIMEDAQVSNVAFGRPGVVTPQDWQVSLTGDTVSWTAVSGGLDWGTLYNFRFDSTGAPVETDFNFGVLEPGSPTAITASGLAPSCLSESVFLNMLPDWQNTCTILELVAVINQLCQ